MKMKLIFLLPILLINSLIASEAKESVKVAELTVIELREIVRSIVQDSIEKCEVNGTMEGRAKVNLKVEGEVKAKMSCNFEEPFKENLDSRPEN
jgi:hypothetical protein